MLDLVICHGSFLNANHEYVHENKSVRGFGSYGDILIRDRKMYVVPTPFRVVVAVRHQQTLILPAEMAPGREFASVGDLCRRETDELVIGYSFDLQTNELHSEKVANPSAGREHLFRALATQGIAAGCGFDIAQRPQNRTFTMKPNRKSTLIESDEFPFEFLSPLAERESWRKEVHRPIYHVHKWWAKRLGSVFRGILLGASCRMMSTWPVSSTRRTPSPACRYSIPSWVRGPRSAKRTNSE